MGEGNRQSGGKGLMAKLTALERAYNSWWMSRFDSSYKKIRLYNDDQLVDEYGTANKRYTDLEDARCAFYVAKLAGTKVTSVAVGEKRYHLVDGKQKRLY
jgi:hypothetical protein